MQGKTHHQKIWEIEDIDYNSTFAFVVKLVTIRMLSVIAAQFSWKVHQINIKTVSLNGYIKIEVCMEKPQDSLQRVKKHGYVGESSV